jgi:uncharacterized protein GlcG (DUF336 family)
MSLKLNCAVGVAMASMLPSLAGAQGVVTERNVSLGLAQSIAQSALDACRSAGYHVSVTVVDRAGQVRVLLRDDGTSVHTVGTSRRKAFTSRAFRVSSSDFAKRVSTDTSAAGLKDINGVITLAGGLPIKIGDETIGAVGVSGAPGGEKDEACAKAGIEKVADQLK